MFRRSSIRWGTEGRRSERRVADGAGRHVVASHLGAVNVDHSAVIAEQTKLQ
jgi:hypothetical protein